MRLALQKGKQVKLGTYEIIQMNRYTVWDERTGETTYSDDTIVLTLERVASDTALVEKELMSVFVKRKEFEGSFGDRFELSMTPATVVQKTG